MQKTIDKKQTWMTADRNNGTLIGNAQIGPASSATVIGNAVIGGMAACCGTDPASIAGEVAEVADDIAKGTAAGTAGGRMAGLAATGGSTMIGNASITGGVVGNVVIESPNWKHK